MCTGHPGDPLDPRCPCPETELLLRLREPELDAQFLARGRRGRMAVSGGGVAFLLAGILLRKVPLGFILTELGILILFFTYLHFLGEPKRLEQLRRIRRGWIRVPFCAADLREQDPLAVRERFSRLGFRNILLRPVPASGRKARGSLASVTIGGSEIRSGCRYDPNAPVVIYCYTEKGTADNRGASRTDPINNSRR